MADRHILAGYFLDCVQADYAFIGQINLVVFVDVYSRYAWVYKARSKKAEVSAAAFHKFFNEQAPKNITTDNGSEFLGAFSLALAAAKTRHWKNSPGDHRHMGIVERFNRTLKERCKAYKGNWFTALDSIVSMYNNTYHHTIMATPNQVRKGVKRPLSLFSEPLIHRVKVGDLVRKRTQAGSWSEMIYTVKKIDRGHAYLSDGTEHWYKPDDLQLSSEPAPAQKTKPPPKIVPPAPAGFARGLKGQLLRAPRHHAKPLVPRVTRSKTRAAEKDATKK